jgi:hypothetical protein
MLPAALHRNPAGQTAAREPLRTRATVSPDEGRGKERKLDCRRLSGLEYRQAPGDRTA